MSLALLWASPWNETSAIAAFGLDVTRELERMGFKVDILRTEVGEALALPPLPAAGEIHDSRSLLPHEILTRYDGVVLNLGNHHPFHGGGLAVLRDNAPLVIFHDAWMGDFHWGWRNAPGSEAARVSGFMADAGGDPSGLAPLCAMASGAVVHGPHYLAEIERGCSGPVASIPLAYSFPPVAEPRLQGDRLVVATVGHINSNKRAEEVLRALSMSPMLRSNVSYWLMGPIHDAERARLTTLAERWRVPAPRFTGWLSDIEMRAMMDEVDVFCCLRDPCYEGGSASLVVALLAARPTLVSNQAHYSVLPDDVVLKCAPGREALDVVDHLEWVIRQPHKARELGAAAREFATATHSPRAYAERLAPLIGESIRAAPAVRAGLRTGALLAGLGFPPGDPVLGRVAANLDHLLGA